MAKAKQRTEEEKQADLARMLGQAAVSNHTLGETTPTPAVSTPTSPAPTTEAVQEPVTDVPVQQPQEIEQKGENTSAGPIATESPVGPQAELPAPTPTPTPAPTPAPAPAPTPVLVAAESSESDSLADVEDSAESEATAAVAGESENLDLASLFGPSGDKKTFTMRLTDAQYQYLLLLGTIVGNGTSPPDIVHNIIAQFIHKNDKQIQRAIQKQLRQRLPKKS